MSTAVVCSDQENWVKIIKQNRNHATEESVHIYDGTRILYTSPPQVIDQLYSIDYCLEKTVNDQYTISLVDSYGDSWTNGAYLEVHGPYENIVFKGYLYAKRTLTNALSLYNPLKTNAEWKFTNSYGSGWTSIDYNDDTWTSVVLGNPSTPTDGTQYFRKHFTGISNMAAYEVRMRFRYGIIAYINGMEIYRRNMPVGEVTSSTEAIGSFTTSEFRGVVRSGLEIESSDCVLAVEIHMSAGATVTSIDFDAWLSVYAAAMTDVNCYPFPYSPTITSTGGESPIYAMDYYKSRVYSIPLTGTEDYLSYSFTVQVIPAVNAIMWYPASMGSSGATAYNVLAAPSLESAQGFSVIKTMYNQVYTTEQFTIAPIYNANTPYGAYRFQWLEGGSQVMVPELYLGVCNIPVPTSLTLSVSSLSVYTNVEQIHVYVTTLGAGNCTITPSLPNGLVFDSVSCSISGIATETLPQTTFVVSSYDVFGASASFTLTVNMCSNPIIEIERVYKGQSSKEGYKLINLDTEETILSVEPTSNQQDNTISVQRICSTASRYEVETTSSGDYWYKYSYLNVYVLHGAQREQILRCNYDNTRLSLPGSYYFSVQQPISDQSQWYYKMGEVPTNWYDTNTPSWEQGSYGQFPNSTNHLQIYKKIFSVSSLENGGAFSLGIRYKFGCIVYMNGVEVFRNNVPDGQLTMDMTADGLYNEVKYRFITLPYRTVITSGSSAVDYLKVGQNSIAIALVGLSTTTPTVSEFDAVIRLFGSDASTRVMDATFTQENVKGEVTDAWDLSSDTGAYNSECGSNWIQITFNDDRREWISSVTLQAYYSSFMRQWRSFKLLARNKEEEEWTQLLDVSELKWWVVAQNKLFYLNNNKPYNMYRFTNFASDIEDCYWYVNRVELNADRIEQNIPDLSYESPLTAFRNIEMAEVYPTDTHYLQFTVSPALPAGLSLDPPTGILMGTPTELTNNYHFTISALKLSGEATSCPMVANIISCTGDHNLITVTIRSDSYPSEMKWAVYHGRGTTGPVLKRVDVVAQRNTLYYGDFCIEPALYTFEAIDTSGDGWFDPAGYCLSIDQGELRFDINQVPKMTKPSIVTTTFTSLVPFQIEFTDWTIAIQSSLVTEGWTLIDYDASQWSVMKAADLGMTTENAVYIRKTFNIPSLEDYQVLNIRVRYMDGLAAYFNGKRVALFNMPSEITPETNALAARDPSLFSKFHVILSIDGGVDGTNVIAFEMHRATETPTSVPMSFDASGIFGVETCSPVVDTYVSLESSQLYAGTVEEALDMYMLTRLRLPTKKEAYIQWTVENLLGSKFNQFAIQNALSVTNYYYSFYGSFTGSEDRFTMVEVRGKEMEKNKRMAEDTSVGFMGFNTFRFEQDENESSNTLTVMSFVSLYCKASGTACPGIDEYPSVSEGQISPASCPYGFKGYSYRNCTNGVLSDVISDRCVYRIPEDLTYQQSSYVFVLGTKVTTGKPRYKYVIEEFSLDNVELPEGLELDSTTGEIFGTPQKLTDISSYTVFGRNPVAATAVVISITVRRGYCLADGVFSRTYVDETAFYSCRELGSYIGTKKRACVLGDEDGVWEKESGFCMPIMLLIIFIVVIIVIIIVIILILLKVNKKKKAAPGAKAKGKMIKAKPSVV